MEGKENIAPFTFTQKVCYHLADPFCDAFIFLLLSGGVAVYGCKLLLKNVPMCVAIPMMIGGAWLILTHVCNLAQGGEIPNDLLYNTNLKMKTAIVTGGNCGIGKETAVQLVKWGAHVLIACRDPTRTKEAIRDITNEAGVPNDGSRVSYINLDLADLHSVKRCSCEIEARKLEIDILVNNAGVMMPPLTKTKQGIELQFGTNHLGHFLLTLLLLDNLKRNHARVINVSSRAHSFVKPHQLGEGVSKGFTIEEIKGVDSATYDKSRFYGISKMANILFTKELQFRLLCDGASKATTYCVHPGCVYTSLGRWLPGQFLFFILGHTLLKTAKSGAKTTLTLCAEDKSSLVPGGFYEDCNLSNTFPEAQDTALAKELWSFSEKAVHEYLQN